MLDKSRCSELQFKDSFNGYLVPLGMQEIGYNIR